MKSSEVRKKFLDFFKSKNHKLVKSSSLIPFNDNTLLFTNAGMNQFKDIFLGFETRDYSKAVSAQKCLRAGGKHNDLENVGYTQRHHTFFEMLGNFSFGDYFKEQAIKYAWEFLTDKKWLSLPEDKLLVTIYDQDNEAYHIWKNEIGLSDTKIISIGDNKGSKYASDNFWHMGDIGPCGPCSEIFYDHGKSIFGGIPGSQNEDGDRYVEIWNCVFMQYNMDENGNLKLLPKPCVDTGMGLERITAVMQNVHSNYHIDLFQNLIKSAAQYTNSEFDLDNSSLRVIADHIRSCAFLIADGILPGNEGRDYVLRRIIRRAIRHGFKLGQKKAFFYKMSDDLANQMGQAYPELNQNLSLIKEILYNEEIKFSKTLEIGISVLNQELENNPKFLDGKTAFKLYDTYGFPFDLTADICKEKGIKIDEDEFNIQMNIQKQRAKLSSKFKTSFNLEYSGNNSKFIGYDNLKSTSEVISLFNKDNQQVERLQEGDIGIIILDITPFYAQSGGQIGDKGIIYYKNNIFEVNDTKKIKSNVFGHHGIVTSGIIQIKDKVSAEVNINARQSIMRNHSVTHLLHSSLIKVLGNHVEQKGSLVTQEKTRFDFSHDKPILFSQIIQIENLVNQAILDNCDVLSEIKPYDTAVNDGAIALFNEKYENKVRVIKMGSYSKELCGGTHVKKTGDIGFFKIISESSIASGIRRIEGITGINSIHWIHKQEKLIQKIMFQIKAKNKDEIIGYLDSILKYNKDLEREILNLKNKLLYFKVNQLKKDITNIKGIDCLFKIINIEEISIRDLIINLTSNINNLVVLLACIVDNKISICCGISKDIVNKFKANDLIKYVNSYINGKGGGNVTIAQASSADVQKLPGLMKILPNWIDSQI